MVKKMYLISFLFILLSVASSSAQSTREDFLEKYEALDINDNKGRLAVLDAAIKAFPKDADLYQRRAELKTSMEEPFSRKDTYGFIADYSKAIEFDNVSWRYASRANGYILLEDYKAALTDCNTAVGMALKAKEQEHLFSGYFRRSEVYAFLKDYKNALADLENARKYHADENSFLAAMIASMADYAIQFKDYALALKYIDQSIAIYKKLGDATEGTMYHTRAMLKIEHLNKKQEGCADLKKALSIANEGMKDIIANDLKKHCK